MTDEQFRQEAERLSPALYRMAMSIVRSSFDAEDAAQEALQKAWIIRERCRNDTFPAYLMRIVINECRNIQRHRMRVQPARHAAGKQHNAAKRRTDRPSKRHPHPARYPAYAAAAEIHGGMG